MDIKIARIAYSVICAHFLKRNSKKSTVSLLIFCGRNHKIKFLKNPLLNREDSSLSCEEKRKITVIQRIIKIQRMIFFILIFSTCSFIFFSPFKYSCLILYSRPLAGYVDYLYKRITGYNILSNPFY